MLGKLASIVLLCYTLTVAVSCQKSAPLLEEERSSYTWSGIGFGIDMSVELYDVTETQGEQISGEIEQIIQQLERAFSLYSEDSELSRLNREKHLANPSAEFKTLLEQAKVLNSRTLGYYQPAIHGAWSFLAERHTDPQRWKLLNEAASLDKLEVVSSGVKLTNPLAELSFNAIVQGYLTDKVAAVLQEKGVKSALVNCGESYAIGQHPEGRPWALAVMGTAEEGEIDLVGTIEFLNAGLAVSAHDAERLLLDPVSHAVGSSDRVVAVISAEGATVADAFATAFAVTPRERWEELHKMLIKGGTCQVKIWDENTLVFEL